MRRWGREPLVHFALLGIAVFWLHRQITPANPREEIEVSAAVVHGLRADFERRNGAAPTTAELDGLIQRYIDGEILYREGLRLGLDRGDIIVRRRMIQKMELLAEALEEAPSDTDLSQHMSKHASRYALPDRIGFEHVFTRNHSAAMALREQLLRGTPANDLGEPFVRGRRFPLQARSEIAAIFGDRFADELFVLKQESWSEPLTSAYGFHLVRITEREPGQPPALADIRSQVAADWKEERQEQARRAQVDELRSRYRVRLAPSQDAGPRRNEPAQP